MPLLLRRLLSGGGAKNGRIVVVMAVVVVMVMIGVVVAIMVVLKGKGLATAVVMVMMVAVVAASVVVVAGVGYGGSEKRQVRPPCRLGPQMAWEERSAAKADSSGFRSACRSENYSEGTTGWGLEGRSTAACTKTRTVTRTEGFRLDPHWESDSATRGGRGEGEGREGGGGYGGGEWLGWCSIPQCRATVYRTIDDCGVMDVRFFCFIAGLHL